MSRATKNFIEKIECLPYFLYKRWLRRIRRKNMIEAWLNPHEYKYITSMKAPMVEEIVSDIKNYG